MIHRTDNKRIPLSAFALILFTVVSIFILHIGSPSAMAESDKNRADNFFKGEEDQKWEGWSQKRKAAMKEVQKQSYVMQRDATQDPGMKQHYQQKIDKLQNEINKHMQQADALEDHAKKAKKAGKKAESGNQKKGKQRKGRKQAGGQELVFNEQGQPVAGVPTAEEGSQDYAAAELANLGGGESDEGDFEKAVAEQQSAMESLVSDKRPKGEKDTDDLEYVEKGGGARKASASNSVPVQSSFGASGSSGGALSGGSSFFTSGTSPQGKKSAGKLSEGLRGAPKEDADINLGTTRPVNTASLLKLAQNLIEATPPPSSSPPEGYDEAVSGETSEGGAQLIQTRSNIGGVDRAVARDSSGEASVRTNGSEVHSAERLLTERKKVRVLVPVREAGAEFPRSLASTPLGPFGLEPGNRVVGYLFLLIWGLVFSMAGYLILISLRLRKSWASTRSGRPGKVSVPEKPTQQNQ